jgi:hypothetical protein
MTLDRLQAAWGYTNAEIWRPLFDRYRDRHHDLPIEIVRVMLVRPRGMRRIFVETGKLPALDGLRADVATFLDLPRDARAALRRIRPQFFTGGRAIALLLSEIDEGLRAYDDPEPRRYYGDRVERFLGRHVLPYRLDREPLKLTPLLHGEVDELYRTLRVRATADEKLSEALSAFESAWERHSTDWSQINAKDVIRTASLFAESALVSASNGGANEFTPALDRLRRENRFPSNDFANIFGRAYVFANNYPNIRHSGRADYVCRDLRKEDTLLAALVFVGLYGCIHNLGGDDDRGGTLE